MLKIYGILNKKKERDEFMTREYALYAVDKTKELLDIDSPSGYTKKAADWVYREITALGFPATITTKGGVLVDLGGADENDALLLQAHIDTNGAMVAEVKSNGRLKATNIGGMNVQNAEGENVRIYTRDGRIYDGTLQICNPSVHVNKKYKEIERSFNNAEIVIDEDVKSADDTRALGIEVGDIICFDTRTRVTESGYIKSRFLDDKLAVGTIFALAKFMKDNGLSPKRKVYVHITVFEEVGHGGAASVPNGTTEVISVDMGCVGEGISCTEKMVSICVKDSRGPYNYDVVTKLIEAAKKEGADYALDVYPSYGSDADTTLVAGNDLRHGLIGAGVYASHGYERSHIDGVHNALKVLKGYLEI